MWTVVSQEKDRQVATIGGDKRGEDIMADLIFSTELQWQGTGREGEGKIKLGDFSASYAAPASMGGKGVGTSPEELLIAAVSTCYSGTLFGVLRKNGLLVEKVSVRAEGLVTGYPMQSKFSRLSVFPTIFGGNPDQVADYQRTAEMARDKCFIGKVIAGNVSYEVGDVQVFPSER